jgi:aspartate/glutamate racemase
MEAATLATILCRRLLSNGTSSLANTSKQSLEVSLHSHPLSDYMRAIDVGNWHGVAQLMLSSARKLASIGAEFLIAPCNTIHQARSRPNRIALPWLHIAEEDPVYRSCFDRQGIKLLFPEARERERLNASIFNEVVQGAFTEDARRQVSGLIVAMKANGCDAAGLCCTDTHYVTGSNRRKTKTRRLTYLDRDR